MQLSRRRRWKARGEEGVALAVAVVVMVVVVILSTSALQQSTSSITQSGIAGKQVSSTDAAEAGVQAEYHQIVTQASSQKTTFSCPTTSTSLSSSGAFSASYVVSCAPVGTTTNVCTTGSAGSCTLTPASTYQITATGTTTAKTIGSKTLVAQVYVPTGLTGTKSTSFPEAIFAGVDIGPAAPGSFTVSKPTQSLTEVTPSVTGGAPSSTGGDTYSGSVGQCASSTIGNNYYDLGNYPTNGLGLSTVPLGATSTFTGNCTISGDIVMDSTSGVTLNGTSTGVGGNIYSKGPTTLTGSGTATTSTATAQTIGGSIYSEGPVVVCPSNGSDRINGGILTGTMGVPGSGSLTNVGSGITFGSIPGTSTTCAGTIAVVGDINSDGPLTGTLQNYGSFGVYANGAINLTNSHVNGTLLGEQNVTATNTSVGGIVMAAGALTLNNVTVPQVQGLGTVTLNGGTYGSVDAVGNLTVTGNAQINGTIYAEGGITFTSGTVTPAAGGAAIEVEAGGLTVNCNNQTIGGALYYFNATLQNCTAGAHGPTAIYKYTSAFNSRSGTTPPNDYPPQSGLGINGVGGFNSSDETNTASVLQTATVIAANTINGTTGATTSSVSLPSLTFDANSWYANNDFCGRGTAACTSATMNILTNQTCTQLAADVLAMATAGALPTVITTSCAYQPAASTTGVALKANLAIYDSAGFTFPTSFTAGFSSGDGSAHQLYLIVPTGSVQVLGQASCGGLNLLPDVVLNGPLTDSSNLVQDFVYTAGSVCNNAGSTSIYGKVYAGNYVQPSSGSSSWKQGFYDISPWTATAGTVGLLGTPSIVSVTQTANPAGTT